MKNTSSRAVSVCITTVVSLTLILFSYHTSEAQSNVIKWRLQAAIAMASPTYTDSVLRVAELVKERTDGRLIIEPHPAGALIPSDEIFPAVRRGMLEMGFVTPAYWRADIPLSQVTALPYAFKNYWEVMYFYKKLGFEQMLRDQIETHGVLYWTGHALPVEIVTKEPIRSLADLQGKKIRTYGQFGRFFNEIGAQAVSAPGPEIYTGLATGVFHGAHWAAAVGADSLALYEICKYHMKPSISLGTEEGFFVSKKAFERLPADIQEVVQKVLDDLFWIRTVEYAYNEEVTLARVQQKYGVEVVTLPLEDQRKMAQSAQKIWDEIGGISPENEKAVAILKQFLKDLGRL